MNLFLYFAVLLLWGTTWFGITLQIDSDVDPIISVGWRFVIAALFLFAWCYIRQKPLKFSLYNHKNWLMIGLCLFCANYICVYIGTQYLPSGLVALIFSTITIFTIVNGALWFQKAVSGRAILGSIMGVLGLALVFHAELTQIQLNDYGISLHNPLIKGLLWVLSGTFIASLGMLMSGRMQSKQVPLLQSNTYSMLYGALLTLCIGIMLGGKLTIEPSINYLGSLLFLAILGSVLGFGAYLKLLHNIGADKASYANVFTPIVALGLSALFEGYVWTMVNIVGISFIIMGNIIVLYKPRAKNLRF